MKTCPNPLAEHMALVDKLGIRGTPFIVLENGQTEPGYIPATHLAAMLNQLGAK